ncbi:MAG: hypothetical protein KatS3mg105_3090 [Gemmatales bacterium]|nr:MAG: hypothetical protein KatS3mg105_3090 [Gemmatales bacterium]
MAIATNAELIKALRTTKLLTPQQLNEAVALQARFRDPRSLSRELLRRGWLTVYQVNQIMQGKAESLVFGSYVLLERLGEGAMGKVFKARHQTMNRIVALKMIRKERLQHPNALRRFRREIRAMAQLSHPNVVTAFDADQVNGVHFYAMEFVEGEDLGKLVAREGPIPIDKACDYIRQAALSLQHAHERGLVHRDIKPSNLLLSKRDSVIKVLDMGLARLQQAEDESTQLTQEGVVMGTPDFIAPEQARDSREADIRSDLYSLGCTFFYLLTGQVPFPGKNLTEKLLMHRTEPPPRVEDLRPEVPTAIGVIIRRLMAKDPAERYQTPAELVHDITYVMATGGLPPSKASWQALHTAPALSPETFPIPAVSAAAVLSPTPLMEPEANPFHEFVDEPAPDGADPFADIDVPNRPRPSRWRRRRLIRIGLFVLVLASLIAGGVYYFTTF